MKSHDIEFKVIENKERLKKLLNKYEKLDVYEEKDYMFTITRNPNTIEKLDLNNTLRHIGKKNFVDYYQILRGRDDAYRYLPIKYSESSRKLRVSYAKEIFSNELEIDALKLIVTSNRVDLESKDKAGLLLKQLGVEIDYKHDVRYMVRNVIPRLLIDGLLDDYLVDLCNPIYCKNNLGISYELLREVHSFFNVEELMKDEKKHIRYYKDAIDYNGKTYLLCSHFENKRHLLKMSRFLVKVLSGKKDLHGIEEYLSNQLLMNIK